MNFFGAAVKATVPKPTYIESLFSSDISQYDYDVYVANGGKMTDREAVNAYHFYCNEDWARWTQYCEGMGLSFYPWEPAEDFEAWLNAELSGGNHKWSWD